MMDIRDIVIQWYQSTLLTIHNAQQLSMSHNLNMPASSYNRWRKPNPYSIFGFDLRREIIGLVIMGVLTALLFLYWYLKNRPMARSDGIGFGMELDGPSDSHEVKNLLDLLTECKRDVEGMELVAENEFKRIEVVAKDLNGLIEFQSTLPDRTRKGTMEKEKRWLLTLKKVYEQFGIDPEQLYNTDSSDPPESSGYPYSSDHPSSSDLPSSSDPTSSSDLPSSSDYLTGVEDAHSIVNLYSCVNLYSSDSEGEGTRRSAIAIERPMNEQEGTS